MNATAALLIQRNAATVDWNATDWFPFDPETTAERCRDRRYLLTKRIMDVPLAAFLLLAALPLLVAVACAIRLTSKGPVLFRQTRLGRNGRRFRCLKFRSMRCDAEAVLQRNPHIFDAYIANGYKLPEDADPRITRLGRFLRKTSLDELPQLVNVLRGEMSLVGPRPIVPAEIAEYGVRANDFVAALPGLTGKWQVSGRSSVQYPARAQLELDYVYGWSPREDLRILVQTVPAVLRRVGAH
jgi:lipopolysaccharide/colanic/teichoic acid biosynthesis glycosyltransferase